MERIQHALAAARQQREELQERSVVQPTAGRADAAGDPDARKPVAFRLMRDGRVWFGIACAAVMIAMLAWMIDLKDQKQIIDMSAVAVDADMSGDTNAQLRADISALTALSETLVLLQARVDSLDDSITRVDDRLTDLRMQINAISSSIHSTTISKNETTTELLAADEAPVPASDTTSDLEATEILSAQQKSVAKPEAADKPAPASNRTPDEAETHGSSAEQKSVATGEDGYVPVGASNATPDEGSTEVSSADEQSLAPAALLRSHEVLQSVPYSDPRILAERRNQQATDSKRTPAEAPTKTASAEQMPAAAKSDGLWVINLASFSDKRAADRFARRAQSRSVHVEQTQVTVKGKSYWRVQMPGFSSAEDARARAGAIETELGLQGTWISRR